jgi:hypothetical protein
MAILKDTVLVAVATLGVGSVFMELFDDSKNPTFNKVIPYVGTFLSAGIGYYFLRQSKLIKAGEYQPDQELSDYSLGDLATSSAIEGFEPFKYSVVGNRAEGLETKKEEPPENEDSLESWMEEYDAESFLNEKPSMNFTWKKFSDWEIEPTMKKIHEMTLDEIIVPYPMGADKYTSLKNQLEIVGDPNIMIYPYIQNINEYMKLVSLSGYLKYGDATFYLLQTNMNVLKEKVKAGDSKYKVENSYLVYCEHDGKMNLVCGASYPIDDSKVYPLLKGSVPIIRQGFVTGRKEATQYAEDYLYFHVMKPELKYSFDESFEIEFGERKQEDYQNMIIPLKYKRKIKGKAIPFTNYYYTNHRGELDFLFAIGELDRPLNEKMTFYCDMGWQFGVFNTTDSNYPMPKSSWSKNYGAERLATIFAERPIIQMWVKSITLDSDNLKTRRINMFNENKQAWFDQQFKPMLVANYSPLILTGWNYPSENVYEEFMKITMKRLEPEKELPATGDVINNFKKGVSYYDWLLSVNNQNSRENPLFYQNASSPVTLLLPRFVNKSDNPYGLSYSRTYYTIQGKRINSINSQIGADQEQDLNLLRIPQPPVGWYKRLRTNSGFQRNDFGRIASNVLTIGVYFNNTIYHTMPTSIIPFEINDTSNQYVKAFRLLYSRALRENKIADPQTIFEDRLKWSYYSLDEDAIMELDRTSDEAKKVVEDYYKQLDDMVLEKLGGYGFKHHSVRKAENFSAEGNKKPYSVEISRSSNPEKKLMAVFEDSEGNKIKTTHFGQRGASDYTKHGDKERMQRYLERHGGGTTTSTKEDWKDPTTAGSLSRWVLWNKPSLSGSFADYKRRFGLKGSLNVSKSAEGLETKNAESYSPGDYNFKQNFGDMNERFEVILESAQKLSKPKLKRVLGLEKENPLTRKPMIKAASIAYFMKEAKDQFPKEMYIEYYMRNFTKQELCHLNLIKGKAGWNLTELRKLNKRELSDMLIIEEMGFAFKSETFEATEWVGFCPECKKWRTKDMSLLFKKNTNRSNYSDEDYIIDLSFNGWSVPKKLLNKRLCGKSKQYGDIQRTTDSWSGYGQRTYSNFVCGTPLTKVKSKYKAEFEAKSPAQKSLDKWTKEDWGTKSGKPSTQGEEATGERYLPAKAREALTDKEYARTTAKKRRDTKAGKQFSPQPDDIEEKVKEYRLETFDQQTVYGKYGENDPFPNKAKTPMIMIDSENDHDGDYSVDEIIYGDFAGLLGQYVIWFKHKVANGWKGLEGFDIKLIPVTENSYSIVILMKGKSIYQNKMWKIATDYDYPKEILPYRTSWSNAESGYDFEGEAYYVKLHRIYVSPDSIQAKLYKPIWDAYKTSMNAETFEAIEGTGSNARFTDQPDPKVYRDTSLRQKARNKLLKGNKGGEEGEWSARKAQMAATEYRKMYENKYGEGKNPYF